MNELTQILDQIRGGDPQAADLLLPVVYDELRKLAAQKLSCEEPGQTLQATALVHEAFLRLVGDQKFENRRHFIGAAAEAMRRILVERARHKQSLKAGGSYQRIQLSEIEPAVFPPDFNILVLNAALEKLEDQDPRRAAVVKLRFFAGLTIEETAATLGIATSTVESDWVYSRCWLILEMRET
jgi:RNA polymerase sigma factor (TIGR02999 family)